MIQQSSISKTLSKQLHFTECFLDAAAWQMAFQGPGEDGKLNEPPGMDVVIDHEALFYDLVALLEGRFKKVRPESVAIFEKYFEGVDVELDAQMSEYWGVRWAEWDRCHPGAARELNRDGGLYQ